MSVRPLGSGLSRGSLPGAEPGAGESRVFYEAAAERLVRDPARGRPQLPAGQAPRSQLPARSGTRGDRCTAARSALAGLLGFRALESPLARASRPHAPAQARSPRPSRPAASRRCASLRTSLARELLEPLAEAGEMELLYDYAQPYSIAVICRMLGVPLDRHRDLLDWSHRMVKMYEFDVPDEAAQRRRTMPRPSFRSTSAS